MQLGALGALHAVRRPGPPCSCEGAVVGRVPVARGDHQLEAGVRGDARSARPAMAWPSGTSSAPPAVKSFWKSTMSRASATSARIRPVASPRTSARCCSRPRRRRRWTRPGARTRPCWSPLHLRRRAARGVHRAPGRPAQARGRDLVPGRAPGRARRGPAPDRPARGRGGDRPGPRRGGAGGRPAAGGHLRDRLPGLPLRGHDPGRAATWTPPGDARSSQVLELSLPDLVRGYESKRLLRRGVPIKTPTYTVDGHFVWGATARMVQSLLQRLEPLCLRPRRPSRSARPPGCPTRSTSRRSS